MTQVNVNNCVKALFSKCFSQNVRSQRIKQERLSNCLTQYPCFTDEETGKSIYPWVHIQLIHYPYSQCLFPFFQKGWQINSIHAITAPPTTKMETHSIPSYQIPACRSPASDSSHSDFINHFQQTMLGNQDETFKNIA